MQYLYEVLAQLVSADTVSHKSSSAAMGLLADHLEGHGFSVRLQHYDGEGVRKTNLVAWAGPPEPDGLILSGHVDVGAGAFIGNNATIRDRVTIGHHAVIGCGAVVLRDVKPDEVYRGYPARLLSISGKEILI